MVVPLLPVPYLLTAGLVALGSTGLLLGVPDIETITAVVVGTVGSWRVLVETAPLVDSEGSVLLRSPTPWDSSRPVPPRRWRCAAAGPRCRCSRWPRGWWSPWSSA